MSEDTEIFLPIKGYEGLYEISNLGRVKSLKRQIRHYKGGFSTIQEKFISIVRHKHGHHVVRLWKENKTKLFNLYRLMAIAFIPNPENKPEVNHKDGDRKSYPNLSNLEWVTPSENMKHAYDTGLSRGNFRKGFEHQFCKFTEKDIRKVFELRKNGVKLVDIGKELNMNWVYASKVLNNPRFKYIKDVVFPK